MLAPQVVCHQTVGHGHHHVQAFAATHRFVLPISLLSLYLSESNGLCHPTEPRIKLRCESFGVRLLSRGTTLIRPLGIASGTGGGSRSLGCAPRWRRRPRPGRRFGRCPGRRLCCSSSW
jgi:hypothetical protein